MLGGASVSRHGARESGEPKSEGDGEAATALAVQPPGEASDALTEGSGGLPRGVIVLLGAAAGIVTVAGLRAFADIVGPVLLALMLTIVVHPFTVALRDRRAPRWLATLVGLVGVYLIVIGMGAVLAISVARLATILPTYQEEFDRLLQTILDAMAGVGVGQAETVSALGDANLDKAVELVRGLVGSLLGLASGLAFLVTVMLFMGLDAGRFSDRLLEVRGQRTPIAAALRGFAQGTRRYLVVSTVFGLIVAVIDTLALWWLGIPLPVLWGLLSFITNYIPNIGFVIGLIPPALLGLLQGGWTTMAAVIVVYSVINVVIQSIIQPKVIGDAVGLSTTMTFLSLVFWAWVLGPLGALLAVPLSLLAKGVLVDIDPNSQWLSPLLSGVPDSDPLGTHARGRPEPDVDNPATPAGPAVTET